MSATSPDHRNELRRRVLIPSSDVVQIVQEPFPTMEADEALVSFRVGGVCGSDTHALRGLHPQITLPYYPGHEVVGVVTQVGADVTHVMIGDRVTPEPTLPCGRCKVCLSGNENVCENLEFLGCGFREGGMADAFTVRASRLHHVPDDFTDLQAVLIEPLATPVHAARLAGDLSGKTVTILGCGTIGLLVLAAAKFRGARRVVMTDVLESKRRRAVEFGADAAFDARAADLITQIHDFLEETVDVVFDCVSIQSSVDTAAELVSRAGTIVIVGVPERDVRVPLPAIQDHQVKIQGSATYVAADYAEAIDIIRGGLVRPDVIVTKSFSLDRVQEAFAAALTGEEVKVVVTSY